MRDKTHLVIIGNSGAAISAVKSIRRVDPQCRITLVSKESHNAYSPVLTSYFISGKVTRAQMALVDEEFYLRFKVQRRYNTRVISLDSSEKKILLEDNTSLSYDKVLIATGAYPNSLDQPLPAGVRVFTLRTIEDAERIRAEMPNWKKVLFAGAGLVSLQIAEALKGYVKGMIFIVGSEQILSQNLDRESSAMIQRQIEAQGGTFLLHRNILQVEGSEREIRLHLDGGETISGNALIVGKGVRPNIPKLSPEGVIKVNRGIFVDERMQTSAEGVFAAGDVCEAADLISGEYGLIPNWPNACFQGEIAGQNMAGGRGLYAGSLAMNVTSLFGLSFASIGHIKGSPDGGKQVVSYIDTSRPIYKKWVFQDDRMVGAIILGDTDEYTLVSEIVRRQKPMPDEKKALAADPANAARLLCGLL